MEEIKMNVVEIFHLSTGVTIFVGNLSTENEKMCHRISWKLLKDGKYIDEVISTNFRFPSRVNEKNLLHLEVITPINKNSLDTKTHTIELIKIAEL